MTSREDPFAGEAMSGVVLGALVEKHGKADLRERKRRWSDRQSQLFRHLVHDRDGHVQQKRLDGAPKSVGASAMEQGTNASHSGRFEGKEGISLTSKARGSSG